VTVEDECALCGGPGVPPGELYCSTACEIADNPDGETGE
jgi:predicted nucleic acid-binding Zn ribbon protein